MNKKDFIIISAIIDSLINQGANIKDYIPADKREKYLNALETKFPELDKEKNMQEELIKTLEKYVKRIN